MAVDVYSKETILNLEGGPVCVYETGNDASPPVLLLHGGMYDEARFSWHHLAPALSGTRHVFAIDFPRHGKSRPWTGAVGQERLIDVVREVIGHFNLPTLPLIGLSMGGCVAIAYMLQYPEQVTGGVFIGPGGLGDKVQYQFFSWFFTKIPGALKGLAHTYARCGKAKLGRQLTPLLSAGEGSLDIGDLADILYEEARKKWQFRESAMDDWQREGLAPFKLKINYLPELHRLSKPTLWLRGKDDPLVGQIVMEEAARNSHGKLHVIENAGHLLPLEQPDEVFRLVSEFLAANGI